MLYLLDVGGLAPRPHGGPSSGPLSPGPDVARRVPPKPGTRPELKCWEMVGPLGRGATPTRVPACASRGKLFERLLGGGGVAWGRGRVAIPAGL